MYRGRLIIPFVVSLVMVATGGWAQTFKDVVILDFSKATDQAQFSRNGAANFSGGRLVLTDALSEASSAFLVTSMQLSDYLVSFDFEAARVNPGDAPADGFTFLAQTAGAAKIGSGGGGLGLTGSAFPGYNYAVEFNSYSVQGLENTPEIVGLDLFSLRTRLNATAFAHVDQGVLHAEIRVTPDVLTLTVSGGKNNLKPTVVLTSPKYLCNKFFNAPGSLFFGFTAGTGGLQQRTSILNFKIQVPQ